MLRRILPDGHEDMSDEELISRLEDRIYDRGEAEALVGLLRSPDSEVVPE